MAGTEVEHLLGALDRQRATFRWKADGLDAAGLNTRIGASALTLGGLLKHLAVVEDEKFTVWLTGDAARRAVGESRRAAGRRRRGRLDLLLGGRRLPGGAVRAVRRRGAALARAARRRVAGRRPGSADHLSFGDIGHPSLRRMLFDLLEEYGRHTGHADLLREAVDGRVGEDPPWDWRPWPS